MGEKGEKARPAVCYLFSYMMFIICFHQGEIGPEGIKGDAVAIAVVGPSSIVLNITKAAKINVNCHVNG